MPGIVGDLREVTVPPEIGAVADIAPVRRRDMPLWLVLDVDGGIHQWHTASGRSRWLASTAVPAEPEHRAWTGAGRRRRLHATPGGRFAAVVNDYGTFGEVIDLRTGRPTLILDNRGYHQEAVPFSLAFTERDGRIVVIHRTDWNRLDASDAVTGILLTARAPTELRHGGDRPDHYLDYFHGALLISPDARRILDDGWIWQPYGVPTVWDLDKWLGGDVWESEDGSSRRHLCVRGDWDRPAVWLDADRVAISGLGTDADDMCPGVRVFDTALDAPGIGHVPGCVEVIAFEGPEGKLFCRGSLLFAAAPTGFSVWDPQDGVLLVTVPGYSPGQLHPVTGEFAELTDDGRGVRLWRPPGG
ncbi:MAG TPA: hypothetical protein VKB69_10975 [Micromonosporaceae bacterium]|nr:hypothetical protein [Micromonosporaceae bacterium]